jgi:fructokinase
MDLVCFGELLIDFVAAATGPLRAAPAFVKAAGGAPANVAVAASRLGCETAFVGGIGADEFGFFLKDELEKNGVNVRGLQLSAKGATPLAFVSLKENAERDFLFYWRGTADQYMSTRAIPVRMVRSSRIFHYGSISLIQPSTRRATLFALDAALESGKTFISCDPNLRLNLWPSASQARSAILHAIKTADLVKVNEEELKFLTGNRGLHGGMRSLSRTTGAALLVTRGPRGAAFQWRNAVGEVPGFAVDAIDTTGAGDGFVAGFLSRLLLHSPGALRDVAPEIEVITRWVRFANAVGALATTRRGAIPAFPAPAEVAALVQDSSGK